MSNPLEQFINKNSQRADEYREIIEEMLGNYSRYGYAQETLIGILDYIESSHSISNGQAQAIENIRSKPNNKHGW